MFGRLATMFAVNDSDESDSRKKKKKNHQHRRHNNNQKQVDDAHRSTKKHSNRSDDNDSSSSSTESSSSSVDSFTPGDAAGSSKSKQHNHHHDIRHRRKKQNNVDNGASSIVGANNNDSGRDLSRKDNHKKNSKKMHSSKQYKNNSVDISTSKNRSAASANVAVDNNVGVVEDPARRHIKYTDIGGHMRTLNRPHQQHHPRYVTPTNNDSSIGTFATPSIHPSASPPHHTEIIPPTTSSIVSDLRSDDHARTYAKTHYDDTQNEISQQIPLLSILNGNIPAATLCVPSDRCSIHKVVVTVLDVQTQSMQDYEFTLNESNDIVSAAENLASSLSNPSIPLNQRQSILQFIQGPEWQQLMHESSRVQRKEAQQIIQDACAQYESTVQNHHRHKQRQILPGDEPIAPNNNKFNSATPAAILPPASAVITKSSRALDIVNQLTARQPFSTANASSTSSLVSFSVPRDAVQMSSSSLLSRTAQVQSIESFGRSTKMAGKDSRFGENNTQHGESDDDDDDNNNTAIPLSQVADANFGGSKSISPDTDESVYGVSKQLSPVSSSFATTPNLS